MCGILGEGLNGLLSWSVLTQLNVDIAGQSSMYMIEIFLNIEIFQRFHVGQWFKIEIDF